MDARSYAPRARDIRLDPRHNPSIDPNSPTQSSACPPPAYAGQIRGDAARWNERPEELYRTRQNGWPAGSAKTLKLSPPALNRDAPSSSTRA
jgi:hypothetical protein